MAIRFVNEGTLFKAVSYIAPKFVCIFRGPFFFFFFGTCSKLSEKF